MSILTASGYIELDDLANESAEWAATHGLVVGVPADEVNGDRLLAHAPMSLLPTPFPRDAFVSAVELQTLFNLLMHRASLDREFLEPIVQECVPGLFFEVVAYEY